MSGNMDMALLAERFHNGERDADDFIFREYFRPMCMVSFRITGQMEAAEDIVADAFVKLFQRRREFPAMENISAFLYVIIRNASLNFKTTERRHREIEHGVAKNLEELTAKERLELMEVELLHLIYKEAEKLPNKCRQIFKLLYFDGLTTAEIANQLNISQQTVRTLKGRAIQQIKISLLKMGEWTTLSLFLFLLGEAVKDNF